MVYQRKIQGVVLAAGRGSRMTQLIGSSVPKCLVPVCGNPLVYYPLKSLELAGFRGKDILVIIQERDDVRRALGNIAERLGLQGMEILAVPEDSEEFGTAESLRAALISKKITRDTLLFSCDTITDISLQEVFDFHEIKESELTALFLAPLQIPEGVKLPGPKSKIKNERDIVGLKPGTNNLIFLASEADCDEEIKLPVSTLKNCPHTKILTGLTDAHIYLISFPLLSRLIADSAEKNFTNFKGEFLPYLIQNQFSPDYTSYPFRFYASIQPSYSCVRVNSVSNFALANKSGDWISSKFLDGVIPKSKCRIAKGCKLWGTTLGENCAVEEKSKVTNTLALDGVIIKSGATVEGCILSSQCVIGANAVIKECLVGPKFQVGADGRFTNEQLTVMEEAYFENKKAYWEGGWSPRVADKDFVDLVESFGGSGMAGNGFGFREVIIDQPYAGKWIDINMNPGGGHSTFQGTKFSDFGGGFSYKPCAPPKSIVQNRCIYWRTLNDTLELTEISMDHNLFDNQVRYIFPNSPIVGPIAIHETETNVIIMVATVTSVHKFVFIHPKRMPELPVEKSLLGNNKPSIFYQICNKPQMSFRSFNLFENAINIPVPLSAACHYVQTSSYPSLQQGGSSLMISSLSCNGDCFFAFSYENGSIQVVKVSKDDKLSTFDLNQTNLFSRIFSGLSYLRGTGTTREAVVGLSFFSPKTDRSKVLYLVTLGMDGHLRLWLGSTQHGAMTWTCLQSQYLNGNDRLFTDSGMILKKPSDHSSPNELPFFGIYVPNDGFRIYNVIPNDIQNFGTPLPQGVPQSANLQLVECTWVDFKDRELTDFTVTSDYLHLLVNNPEEEEWEVKSYDLKESLSPRFNTALLEPLPVPEVQMPDDDSIDPKEFYMDLVFNKSSFNKDTIIQALTMFKKDDDDTINDQDWNLLKVTAINIVDREIAYATSSTDFELSDDDYAEISTKYWTMFYNSCVEYHIHTVKPLGLFFESNTRMICVVKKSRISFLRPTDSLETLYYFPQCVPLAECIDGQDDRMFQINMMLKYFELLDIIESTMEDRIREKFDRRLKNSHISLESDCNDVASLLAETDPRTAHLQQRHFISLLSTKLKEIGEYGTQALKQVNELLISWERDCDILAGWHGDGMEEMDNDGPLITEHFMGSRLGAHLTYKILTQLLQHRFMIARNTIILQSLCIRYFSQNSEEEGIYIRSSWEVRREALAATTYYFALLQLSQQYFEYCRPMLKDRGIKVANSLKAFTADHLKNESFVDIQWPMRLVESFCISNLGGLTIRSRMSRSKKSGILAFAEAAGRAISPNDPTTKDHPLEEFLVATCQYSLLLKYAQYMTTYFQHAKGTTRKFYTGLAHLCLHNFESALSYFRSITFREACDDLYFCVKFMDFTEVDNPPVELLQELYANYFLKIIKLFEIFDQVPAIQRLAEDGLQIAHDDDSATRMCSLAFKSAIKLNDYKNAYKYIMQIPPSDDDGVRERKEKLACLRLFVSRIIERGDVETLMMLNMGEMFNKISTVREQVEDILWSQANLSDPLQKDGAYQILYFYHITLQNFHKAASAMYFRVIQLGERGRGLEGLQAQRDSLLDVLTCLALVENPDYRYVIRKTGVVPQMPEPTRCLDNTVIPPLITGQSTIEVRNYNDIHKELVLCTALIKIAEFTTPTPIKSTEFDTRVDQAIEILTHHHYFDDAFQLAKAWDKPLDSVVLSFTSVCIYLQKGIAPQSGDAFDYIRRVDASELPNGNTDVLELALRILQNYLSKYSVEHDSKLYQLATEKLISCGIPLPQWLIDDYKRRNSAQFLRCYIKYGQWEEATNLVLLMIDATLGRRPQGEFDPSIQRISTYDPVEPVLPFRDINILGNELKVRGYSQKNLSALHQTLQDRVRLFCERVKESTAERQKLFS